MTDHPSQNVMVVCLWQQPEGCMGECLSLQYYQSMNFFNLLNPANHNLQFKLNSNALAPLLNPSQAQETSAFHKLSVPISTDPVGSDPEQSSSYQNILQERQKLINEYLQLNIQLLQKEIAEKEQPQPTEEKPEEAESAEKEEVPASEAPYPSRKKIKKTNQCGHDDKPHYAKGMCCNCYHRKGRSKKPWKCSHDKLYAAGLCQNCYINQYNRKKREEHKQTEPLKESTLSEEGSMQREGESA